MVGRVIQDTLNQYLRNMIMNIMDGNENKTPLMSKRDCGRDHKTPLPQSVNMFDISKDLSV